MLHAMGCDQQITIPAVAGPSSVAGCYGARLCRTCSAGWMASASALPSSRQLSAPLLMALPPVRRRRPRTAAQPGRHDWRRRKQRLRPPQLKLLSCGRHLPRARPGHPAFRWLRFANAIIGNPVIHSVRSSRCSIPFFFNAAPSDGDTPGGLLLEGSHTVSNIRAGCAVCLKGPPVRMLAGAVMAHPALDTV